MVERDLSKFDVASSHLVPRQVAPLRVATLRRVLGAITKDTVAAVRDRAILLLGFASGLRRSESRLALY
ncbi:MAG: hypothetical protein M3R48_06925 [Candidatus Dormibacteraeota bacterium]|nr:hypothetical protein [Candidatus Dormibacteraeota bacterium]